MNGKMIGETTRKKLRGIFRQCVFYTLFILGDDFRLTKEVASSIIEEQGIICTGVRVALEYLEFLGLVERQRIGSLNRWRISRKGKIVRGLLVKLAELLGEECEQVQA